MTSLANMSSIIYILIFSRYIARLRLLDSVLADGRQFLCSDRLTVADINITCSPSSFACLRISVDILIVVCLKNCAYYMGLNLLSRHWTPQTALLCSWEKGSNQARSTWGNSIVVWHILRGHHFNYFPVEFQPYLPHEVSFINHKQLRTWIEC
jgi:hypothetical protein